jgi:hypothetical protein
MVPKLPVESTNSTADGVSEIELSRPVGDRLATIFGSEPTFSTVAEWIDAMENAFEGQLGHTPTREDLCTTPDGNHVVEIDGERESYVCVLDPLMVLFLEGQPGQVRSETPGSGAEIVIDVGREGVETSHEDAVVSIGVAADVSDAAVGPVTPELAYRTICPYVQAFVDEPAFDRWAAASDGVAMAIPIEESVIIARELAATLIERPER